MNFPALVLVGFCLMLQRAESQLVYKAVKIECTGNPLRVTNISCRLKAISWNAALINTYLVCLMPIRNPVIQFQLLKKDYSNQYKPFLVDASINLCDIIDRRSFYQYGVIIWKVMKKYTNINHSCPFSGELFARDGKLDTSILPPLPLGLYVFSFLFTDKNSTTSDFLGTTKIYIEAMQQVKVKKKPRA